MESGKRPPAQRPMGPLHRGPWKEPSPAGPRSILACCPSPAAPGLLAPTSVPARAGEVLLQGHRHGPAQHLAPDEAGLSRHLLDALHDLLPHPRHPHVGRGLHLPQRVHQAPLCRAREEGLRLSAGRPLAPESGAHAPQASCTEVRTCPTLSAAPGQPSPLLMRPGALRLLGPLPALGAATPSSLTRP